MGQNAWYYCLKHQRVEPQAGCRAADRLGPYPDRETAAHALDIAARRTEQADESDERWEQGD
ncbi:hypothetical protein IQ251_09405 [Saccharopolyspora sp. HNM0983]|uniref:SPOR domain-containing protein n=1 Tax=Saccharopolyspora montiporae TaxID=2781240 RepID=A0A929G0C0_9PSEU|nr:hypothetical protein [Saccharopolyspora sp. HNM0983]MBE9374662.1 hypothetical protein [Saccharopolyspora sp. HNM0983]